MIAPLATYGARLLAGFYPDLLFRIGEASRTLYLTFDDGPTPHTPELLAELDRYDARGTFFLQGRYARDLPDVTRALADAGHAVGNHLYAHPDAWRTPEEDVLHELDVTQSLLTDLTGRPVHWMRPPYGRFTNAMRDTIAYRFSQRIDRFFKTFNRILVWLAVAPLLVLIALMLTASVFR